MTKHMSKSKIKWADAYDGAFRLKKAYLLANNYPPNSYMRSLGDYSVDLKNLDLDELKQAYPKAIITISDVVRDYTTSAVDEEEESILDGLYVDGTYERGTITIYDNDVFYEVSAGSVLILYKTGNAEELFNSLMENFLLLDDKPDAGEVSLVAYSQGYYNVSSKISPTTVDIDANYNDDFKEVYQQTVDFLNSRASGLVLYHGNIGCGKTQLIRHLITNNPKDYVIVTNAMAENLASPDFVTFLLENKNSVFILEDCENILKERGVNAFGGAISNLLNMSDGLMSDIFNIKFICTFNADISGIDSALLRPGRCYANYEFKKLCKEKTKNLLNKQGIELPDYKEMSLAEIYNFGVDNEKLETKTIGF